MRPGRVVQWVCGGLGALAVLCCVTPLLPVVLGAAGATSLLSFVYRDIVLMPFALLMFAAAGFLAFRARGR